MFRLRQFLPASLNGTLKFDQSPGWPNVAHPAGSVPRVQHPAEPRTVACRVVIDGRVQGVGYRQACADRARRLGVAGWVRNRRDGRVEAVLEGPADAVAGMVQWCRDGPPLARVTAVRTEDLAPSGLTGFRVAAAG